MQGTLLSCQISGIRSLKDGSISVTLETQELSPGKAGELFSLRNKLAAVYISPKEVIEQKVLDQVDAVDPEFQGKSQSQRLRNVYYKLFEQDHEGYKDFSSYYKVKTEAIITELKNNIL
jgi:hypothetical protein